MVFLLYQAGSCELESFIMTIALMAPRPRRFSAASSRTSFIQARSSFSRVSPTALPRYSKDGAAAAAFFSRFLEDKIHPGAEFVFTGLAHKASQLFETRHVRRRRERHRRLQVLAGPAADLVVRPPPERLSSAPGRRAFPAGHQRPEDVRPALPFLHQVHRHGGQREIRLRCARFGGARASGPTSSTARSTPTPRPRWSWARRP